MRAISTRTKLKVSCLPEKARFGQIGLIDDAYIILKISLNGLSDNKGN